MCLTKHNLDKNKGDSVGYSKKEKDRIYRKTNGYCPICGKKLARKNYGKLGTKGSWEIDHSNPVSRGGTKYYRNLRPTCPSCNRSKGNKRRVKRKKN